MGDIFPSEYDSPFQSLARQRTRRVFGVPIDDRRMAGIAGGLAAYDPNAGFFGNFARSLSGSLQGGMGFDQLARQRQMEDAKLQMDVERGAVDDEYKRALITDLTNRKSADGRTTDQKNYEFLLSLGRPQDEAFRSIFGDTQDDFDRYRGMSQEDRDLYDRMKRAGRPEPNEPLVQVVGPDGSLMYTPRSEAAGMKPPRERSLIKGQERTALAFYNRAKESENSIAALEEKIANMSLPGQYQLRYAPNVLQSSDQQVYRQAQRAFTEARLRKESGAAIPTSEYINDSRTYFAQPGDSPETIKKKRAARKVVLDGLKFQSGQAYEEYYGEPNLGPGQQTGAVEGGFNPDAARAKYGY